MSDDLLFSDENTDSPARSLMAPWQVLVVDDDAAVHEVTRLVMSGFEMDGRLIEFSHCYSGTEARELLAKRKDIALILLDVVMESDQAGLELVRYIREEIKNLQVRIILRTGQPGQAPEEKVIRDYDINDYKEKTDLTRRKLITVFYAGLRAYRDLMRIEHARLGLRRSIEAICELGESRSLRGFASAVLDQVNYLLDLHGEGLCASCSSAYTANSGDGRIQVLATTPGYAGLMADEEFRNLAQGVQDAIRNALKNRASSHAAHNYVGYFRTKAGSESVIYMEFPEPVSDDARELLEILARNIAITYDGLLLQESIALAQRNTIAILGGAIETRSQNGSGHRQKVGDIAALLALHCSFADGDVEMLRLAAALHDVGKVCVDANILTAPGPLTDEDWVAIKKHSQVGHDLLAQSGSAVHTLAATIALEHHERWDGTGYPRGLKGQEISLAGRIVAIADVLDSLTGVTSFRPAMSADDALEFIRTHSGSHFDPALVALVDKHAMSIRSLCTAKTAYL